MIKKIEAILIFIFISLISMQGMETKAADIIPRPMKVEAGEGTFNLTPKTIIVVTEGTRGIGEYLAGLLGPAAGQRNFANKGTGQPYLSSRYIQQGASGSGRL